MTTPGPSLTEADAEVIRRTIDLIRGGGDPREAGESFIALAHAYHRQCHHQGPLSSCIYGEVPCLDRVERMVRSAASELELAAMVYQRMAAEMADKPE